MTIEPEDTASHPDIARLMNSIRAMGARGDLAAVIVHLNDTYVIEAREPSIPGMARIASLVERVRRAVRAICRGKDRTLVLHSGDFMMPSRLGLETKGAAMTATLARFVDYVALGNHEFDLDAKYLADRLKPGSPSTSDGADRVTAICSNVEFPAPPFPALPLERLVLWPEEDDALFAVVGLMGESVAPGGARFAKPQVAIQQMFERGEVGNARRLIVLSHDYAAQDLELLEFLDSKMSGCPGFAYLLGGHDHHVNWSQTHTTRPTPRTIFTKSLSNARSMRFFLVSRSQLIMDELRRLVTSMGAPTKDQVLANLKRGDLLRDTDGPFLHAIAQARDWPDVVQALTLRPFGSDVGIRLRADALRSIVAEPDHADFVQSKSGRRGAPEILAQRTRPIDITDDSTRKGPTPFGRFVAQCVKRGTNADIAIVHAGCFRGDDHFGPNLDSHLLEDVFIYDCPEKDIAWTAADSTQTRVKGIVVASLVSSELSALLAHGRGRTGWGGFPQTSETPATESLLLHQGAPIRVAIPSYLVCRNGDGYRAALKEPPEDDLLRKRIDSWVRESWSIRQLVNEHAQGFAHNIDMAEPEAISKDIGAIAASFRVQCEGIVALLGSKATEHDAYHAVLGALRAPLPFHEVAWLELDDYRMDRLPPNGELAERCKVLMTWWDLRKEEIRATRQDSQAFLIEVEGQLRSGHYRERAIIEALWFSGIKL